VGIRSFPEFNQPISSREYVIVSKHRKIAFDEL
jgi:hypothetical protein